MKSIQKLICYQHKKFYCSCTYAGRLSPYSIYYIDHSHFVLILGYQPVLNQITLKTLQGLVVLLVHVLLVVSRSERHKKHSLGI
jgi:hypothetical protein